MLIRRRHGRPRRVREGGGSCLLPIESPTSQLPVTEITASPKPLSHSCECTGNPKEHRFDVLCRSGLTMTEPELVQQSPTTSLPLPMAINANRVPPPVDLPEGFEHRVVVKFRSDVQLPYSRNAAEEVVSQFGQRWKNLAGRFSGITFEPYFSTIEESTLRNLQARQVESTPLPSSFTSYYAIKCSRDVEPEQIANEIATWPNVEIAYVEGGPVQPPVNPSDDPRSSSQGYLNAAPDGIDARWAWSSANGSGIGFVDLEQGWTLNHEDLGAANITIISGLSQAYHGHGTAVLGEVVQVDNAIGGIGIAPGATTRVVSQWRTASTYNTAEAILSAVAQMSSGDVLLLEAQTTYPTASGFVPVEVEQVVFDAIQFATSQGIVVVEAGGNGAVDLDKFQDVNGKQILNRASTDFRDSGAIMVGAASSSVPHQRLSFSNFGSRIDCFAWGENIDTCGDGWTGTNANAYTASFDGTSGASPIVTGAALLLQSWKVKRGESRYLPSTLRALLSNPSLNTLSATPDKDMIGVMPNLQAIINRENGFSRFDFNRVLAWAWLILIGGLLITPGGVFCIRCGIQDPRYIGDTLVNILGVGAIVLGGIQLARQVGLSRIRSRASNG